MALYKYATHLRKAESRGFDELYEPGEVSDNSGIYRCEGCGNEIAHTKGTALPPQDHHQHSPEQGKILRKLLVFAQTET